MQHYNHHEAKYVAQQLIWGEKFSDLGLMEESRNNLKRMLEYNGKYGMREYGSLPWFWHWVQALSCVWDKTDDTDIKETVDDMLRFLWLERAQFYLKGAWIGPHSRAHPHDVPEDRNTLMDYIQFRSNPNGYMKMFCIVTPILRNIMQSAVSIAKRGFLEVLEP